MKKKVSIMIAAVSILLGTVLGAGLTSAYLTQTTNALENTFTVGRIKADLVEYTDGGREWDDGTDGKNMYPGKSQEKRPVMSIEADSVDCYAYLKIEGADALDAQGFLITYGLSLGDVTASTASGFNAADWEKVSDGAGLDGIYHYIGEHAQDGIVPSSGRVTLLEEPIFDRVTYKITEEGNYEGVIGKVTVTGYAVQAAGFESPEEAWQVFE